MWLKIKLGLRRFWSLVPFIQGLVWYISLSHRHLVEPWVQASLSEYAMEQLAKMAGRGLVPKEEMETSLRRTASSAKSLTDITHLAKCLKFGNFPRTESACVKQIGFQLSGHCLAASECSRERGMIIENVHRATRAEACGRLRGRDLFAEGLRKLCG